MGKLLTPLPSASDIKTTWQWQYKNIQLKQITTYITITSISVSVVANGVEEMATPSEATVSFKTTTASILSITKQLAKSHNVIIIIIIKREDSRGVKWKRFKDTVHN